MPVERKLISKYFVHYAWCSIYFQDFFFDVIVFNFSFYFIQFILDQDQVESSAPLARFSSQRSWAMWQKIVRVFVRVSEQS